MRRLALLATTATLGLSFSAMAQPVTGVYIGAGAGGNFLQSETVTEAFSQRAYSVPVGGGRSITEPGENGSSRSNYNFDAGGVAVGSVGYGLGNGLRLEVEGDDRYNQRSAATHLNQQTFGPMVNVLYDIGVGSPDIFPYVGAGAGYQWQDRDVHDGRTNSAAYQAIAGVAFPIAFVPHLSLTVEYRFLGLANTGRTDIFPSGVASIPAINEKISYSFNFNHSILLGLRYALFQPAPRPVSVVPNPAAPAPAAARTYLVFFDWDRSDLTDRARQIVAEAAQARTRVQTTRIEVQGNADRSGSPAYNQTLSLRRAETVAAELVRDGVAKTAIDIQAFGDTRPLVPTAPGVREPQNRRVAIILR